MPTISYTSAGLSSNFTLRRDGILGVTFSNFTPPSYAIKPPAGSTLVKATVQFSNVRSWRSGKMTSDYGSFDFDSSYSGSEVELSGASATLLNFPTGGSIRFTLDKSAVPSDGDCTSYRSGCTCTLTLEYTIASGSTGSLDKMSVPQKKPITLTINSSSDQFYHKVLWSAGMEQFEKTLGQKQYTDTITIPVTWPVGTGYVSLTTYLDKDYLIQVGETQRYSFSITLDTDAITPDTGALSTDIVQPSCIPEDWGSVFVQGYSQCRVSLDSATPGEGMAFRSVTLSVGSQTKTITQDFSALSFTSAAINEFGTVTCRGSVTNSNGKTANASSRTITVYEYAAPVINTLSAFRCNSAGVPTDKGQYIAVRVICTCSSIGGKNSLLTIKAQYRERNTKTWGSAVNVTNNTVTRISGQLSLDKQYEVMLTVKDVIQTNLNISTTSTVNALTTSHVIFCADGGINVCFGCEDTSTQNAVIISKDWKLYQEPSSGSTMIDLTGTVPIERGGTGATTAAGARNALGLGNTTGALPIANGGTGATSAAAARSNLGLGNTDGALPVANGGTGANNAASARTNLGITCANIGAATAGHTHASDTITSVAMTALPFKIDHGSVTLSGTSWSTVSFNFTFNSTPSIVATYSGNANSSGINVIKTTAESTQSFQICMAGTSGSGSRTVSWIAIGT